jgi:maltooligosyltrehalose trehalohydrolase
VVLDAYRQLATLRRTRPALTDASFTQVVCTADEATRVFTMRRRDLLVVVNFGTDEREIEAPYDEVLFATPSGVTLADGRLVLPPHAACLLG